MPLELFRSFPARLIIAHGSWLQHLKPEPRSAAEVVALSKDMSRLKTLLQETNPNADHQRHRLAELRYSLERIELNGRLLKSPDEFAGQVDGMVGMAVSVTRHPAQQLLLHIGKIAARLEKGLEYFASGPLPWHTLAVAMELDHMRLLKGEEAPTDQLQLAMMTTRLLHSNGQTQLAKAYVTEVIKLLERSDISSVYRLSITGDLARYYLSYDDRAAAQRAFETYEQLVQQLADELSPLRQREVAHNKVIFGSIADHLSDLTAGYLQLGDQAGLERCVSFLEELIQEYPEAGSLWSREQLAGLWQQAGNNAQAVAVLKKAEARTDLSRRMFPRAQFNGLYSIAAGYERLDDRENALRLLGKVRQATLDDLYPIAGAVRHFVAQLRLFINGEGEDPFIAPLQLAEQMYRYGQNLFELNHFPERTRYSSEEQSALRLIWECKNALRRDKAPFKEKRVEKLRAIARMSLLPIASDDLAGLRGVQRRIEESLAAGGEPFAEIEHEASRRLHIADTEYHRLTVFLLEALLKDQVDQFESESVKEGVSEALLSIRQGQDPFTETRQYLVDFLDAALPSLEARARNDFQKKPAHRLSWSHSLDPEEIGESRPNRCYELAGAFEKAISLAYCVITQVCTSTLNTWSQFSPMIAFYLRLGEEKQAEATLQLSQLDPRNHVSVHHDPDRFGISRAFQTLKFKEQLGHDVAADLADCQRRIEAAYQRAIRLLPDRSPDEIKKPVHTFTVDLIIENGIDLVDFADFSIKVGRPEFAEGCLAKAEQALAEVLTSIWARDFDNEYGGSLGMIMSEMDGLPKVSRCIHELQKAGKLYQELGDKESAHRCFSVALRTADRIRSQHDAFLKIARRYISVIDAQANATESG